MWITFLLITLVGLSTTQASNFCEHVLNECHQNNPQWTRCFEDTVRTCTVRNRFISDFMRLKVPSSQEAEASPTPNHRVNIPSSALKKSRGVATEEEVLLVATVINSTYFKRKRGRTAFIPSETEYSKHTVLGGLVLAVMAGNHPVSNLTQHIKLSFKHSEQVDNGICVFWQELDYRTGHWSRDGCETSHSGSEFICSCDHLSFFAVLVNPELSVDKTNSDNLSYITYIGSALSVFFTVISLIIYICLQRRRPEKAIALHMQLTGALFCLHLSFLLCSFWVSLMKENEESLVCKSLGFLLHWSLLATFTWTALEGFHLYLLLVRVFNIYVRRYLLKLSLVGWGLPTLIAVVCGISGVYGKYTLQLKDDKNTSSTTQICWMSSQFPHRLVVSYITTLAFPCLVILYNSCMLGVVVFKLWRVRRSSGGTQSSSVWKKMNKENGSRLWKDCATVLGLSCVLGLPWGLETTTFTSLPAIYVFTILNSLQGLFMFLWSVALSCKSRSENNSSIRDLSSQKIMTTSFNN
ncbi:adhesion G-protein coupled receptor G1-like [Seriola aureovittata]|uniref:adhesion G-protein coupled receptor G1-like n=1 Tax=Seriola aureovittata TaxID=2871759 RepID=UPI0024BDD980|nr:adhesion G-protein coupled receptor G1-like [Seriola aureovittata]